MRRQKLAFEASSPSFLLSSSPLSPCFFSSSSRQHTLHSARRVRTRRKEKLAQRDSCGTLHFTMAKILCKATALARATTHTHTHTRTFFLPKTSLEISWFYGARVCQLFQRMVQLHSCNSRAKIIPFVERNVWGCSWREFDFYHLFSCITIIKLNNTNRRVRFKINRKGIESSEWRFISF